MQAPAQAKDNPSEHRFEIDIDGTLAIADYTIDGDVITFTHTFVPETLRGLGLAGRLVDAGLSAARERKLKVVPECTMFSGYMKKHAQTQDLLADAGRAYLDA